MAGDGLDYTSTEPLFIMIATVTEPLFAPLICRTRDSSIVRHFAFSSDVHLNDHGSDRFRPVCFALVRGKSSSTRSCATFGVIRPRSPRSSRTRP